MQLDVIEYLQTRELFQIPSNKRLVYKLYESALCEVHKCTLLPKFPVWSFRQLNYCNTSCHMCPSLSSFVLSAQKTHLTRSYAIVSSRLFTRIIVEYTELTLDQQKSECGYEWTVWTFDNSPATYVRGSYKSNEQTSCNSPSNRELGDYLHCLDGRWCKELQNERSYYSVMSSISH